MKYIAAGIVAVLMTVASESTANTSKNETLNIQKVKLLKKSGVETVYTDAGKIGLMSAYPTTVSSLLKKVQKVVGRYKIDSIAITVPNAQVEEYEQVLLKAGIETTLNRGENTTRLIGTIRSNVPLTGLPNLIVKDPFITLLGMM